MLLFVRWALCVCFLSVCIPSPAAFAQDVALADEPDIIETPEVVVSATKTDLPVKQVTSAVEVITGEQLEQRKVKTVAEALRWAQGLAVFQSGGPGTAVDVRMRGGTPEQTMVLIDGAIVNSATLGSYDFSNLTTDNIERIEILRGNQSMLWGSDAMGGVINITTKRGRDRPNISAFADYGSFNTIREGASLNGKKGPVDFSGSISRWDATSFSAINYRRGATERDGYHNWQGSVRLGVELPKDGRVEFSFRWLDGIVNFDGFGFDPVTFQLTPADVLGAKSHDTQYVFAGSYTQPITHWWSQKLSMARATDNLVANNGSVLRDLVTGVTGVPFQAASQIETTSNRIEWLHNVQISKPLLLTAGYQFREQQGANQDLLNNTTTIPNKIVSSHSGFADAQLNLWDRLFGTAGIRQDQYNVFGGATTYRVTGGYLHRETGTKLRGSYGTGFRAPTINQLFYPGFGNPNLQPEKSQGLDVAIDQDLPNNRGTLSVGYFWSRYRNLILSAADPVICGVDPVFGTNFCAVNAGLARAEGVEASAKLKLIRDESWIKSLDLQIQYTYTSTSDLTGGQGIRLPKWPLNQWSAILSYQPVEAVRANVEGRFVGQRFNNVGNTQSIPSFLVWNVSATYEVNKQMQIYARVDNIFNEKYEEVLFFGTPIRSVFGGLRVNFDMPL
ncbi:MAG TPA: TonB-dependent receptor [Nitrospira sp.]|nr:TonB-dependent receptor [Nitrospira sp.]